MADNGDGTASNAIWAFAFVIIIALIVGLVYYSGFLSGAGKKQSVDVNVSVPAR